ncbi:hypothetical protein BOFL111202_15330 [Bordetella flabilis]
MDGPEIVVDGLSICCQRVIFSAAFFEYQPGGLSGRHIAAGGAGFCGGATGACGELAAQAVSNKTLASEVSCSFLAIDCILGTFGLHLLGPGLLLSAVLLGQLGSSGLSFELGLGVARGVLGMPVPLHTEHGGQRQGQAGRRGDRILGHVFTYRGGLGDDCSQTH